MKSAGIAFLSAFTMVVATVGGLGLWHHVPPSGFVLALALFLAFMTGYQSATMDGDR